MTSLHRFNERNLPPLRARKHAKIHVVSHAKPDLGAGIKAALNRQPETANPRLALRKIGEGIGE